VGGEIDRSGHRRRELDAFLEARVAEGFRIETHTDTHAIVVEPGGLWRRLRHKPHRYVVQVDEHGGVTMSDAEPIRD
jgi:hypothetical protein